MMHIEVDLSRYSMESIQLVLSSIEIRFNPEDGDTIFLFDPNPEGEEAEPEVVARVVPKRAEVVGQPPPLETISDVLGKVLMRILWELEPQSLASDEERAARQKVADDLLEKMQKVNAARFN
jgi:hypothetical protein